MADVADLAEASYQHAAAHDADCGWPLAGLARLKWLTARYQNRQVTGWFSTGTELGGPASCPLLWQFARRAGPHLLPASRQKWDGPRSGNLAAKVAENGNLVLHSPAAKTRPAGAPRGSRKATGGCSRLLPEVFGRHVRQCGNRDFEEWLRLAHVPKPGAARAPAFAAVMDEELTFALLAASVHLGLSGEIGPLAGKPLEPPPAVWLETDVVAP